MSNVRRRYLSKAGIRNKEKQKRRGTKDISNVRRRYVSKTGIKYYQVSELQ